MLVMTVATSYLQLMVWWTLVIRVRVVGGATGNNGNNNKERE